MCVPFYVDDDWLGSCAIGFVELDREVSHTHSAETCQNDEKGRSGEKWGQRSPTWSRVSGEKWVPQIVFLLPHIPPGSEPLPNTVFFKVFTIWKKGAGLSPLSCDLEFQHGSLPHLGRFSPLVFEILKVLVNKNTLLSRNKMYKNDLEFSLVIRSSFEGRLNTLTSDTVPGTWRHWSWFLWKSHPQGQSRRKQGMM